MRFVVSGGAPLLASCAPSALSLRRKRAQKSPAHGAAARLVVSGSVMMAALTTTAPASAPSRNIVTPVDDEGMVLWSSAPYRIASRSVLCDCDAGAWVAHKQATADAGTVAPHLGGTWQPILTWQQALERFQRADARLYITGTEHRLVRDDRRPGSTVVQPSRVQKKKKATPSRQAI